MFKLEDLKIKTLCGYEVIFFCILTSAIGGTCDFFKIGGLGFESL